MELKIEKSNGRTCNNRNSCSMKGGLFIAMVLLFCIAGCKKDAKESILPPVITLENGQDIFSVKVGKALTISPTYRNCTNAVYVWRCNGNVVGNEPNLNITFTSVGDNYIDLDVTNEAGSAFKQMVAKVLPLDIPTISLAVPEGGYKIVTGYELRLEPDIANATDATTYSWSVNGTERGTERSFKFVGDEKGTYAIRFTAKGEDGPAELDFNIVVLNPDEVSVKWYFDKTLFNLSTGRRVMLKAYDVEGVASPKYEWSIVKDNKELEVTETDRPEYLFSYTEQGAYKVVLTLKSADIQMNKELTVNVCPPEGTYRRSLGSSNSEACNKVYEYLPAPGQFINEGFTCTTMEEAVAFAESRFKQEAYVCLGGFGGYIIVGFDHSVENDGDYNIQVVGNAFDWNSEPGIVWVMQDENGDGLPNDTWYELKGSETEKGTQTQDYAVTYYRPSAPSMAVVWSDNKGGSGTIDYLSAFHTQEYYYPLWVKEDSYLLRGTCLPPKNRMISENYWINGPYDWGYADNYSSVDRLTDDDNAGAAASGNHFKISNAIDFEGKPVELKYIDFVKVVTGVNAKSGWLGELSTEVFGVNDFNILKKGSGSNL